MSELESAINVLVNAMIDSKANNYNQHIVSGDNGIDYVVTAQVKNGLTPCQKLAKIEAQSEWISVDTPEDMPIGEEVLCWDDCQYHLDYADMDAVYG